MQNSLPTLEDFKKEFGIVPFIESSPSMKYDYQDIHIYVYNEGHRIEIHFNWESNKNGSNKYATYDGRMYDHGMSVRFRFHGLKSKFQIGIDNVDPEVNNVRDWDYAGFQQIGYGIALILIKRDDNPRAFQIFPPKESDII